MTPRRWGGEYGTSIIQAPRGASANGAPKGNGPSVSGTAAFKENDSGFLWRRAGGDSPLLRHGPIIGSPFAQYFELRGAKGRTHRIGVRA